MKDETSGLPIKGFIGLKSKLYTFITEENHETKKSKAINKAVANDELKYEDYKNVLFSRSYMRQDMNRIQSKNQNIGSYRINKIYLPSYDDQKYVLKDEYSKISLYHNIINLLAYHIKINFR